jgi:hypothetical protein
LVLVKVVRSLDHSFCRGKDFNNRACALSRLVGQPSAVTASSRCACCDGPRRGPVRCVGGGWPRPSCLGAVSSPLFAWARWRVGRSGSAPVVSVPTSAPLWLGRWLHTHVKLFHRPLVRVSVTPSSTEGTIFWRDPFLPFFPRPPGRWDCGEQSSREGPPPPNQPCPGVPRLMALPTDLTSPPAWSHRAPILELFGVGPLRLSSAVTAAVVRAVCP